MRCLPPKVLVVEVTVGYTNRDMVYELKEVTEPCSSPGLCIHTLLYSVLGKSMNLIGNCLTALSEER